MVLHCQGWQGTSLPAASDQTGRQVINLSPLKELCSRDSLQMGREKALGKLQKEITLQDEKWMHIYQPWVTDEQPPSIWDCCWNQLQSCSDVTMAALLDFNLLPKQRPLPNLTSPGPHTGSLFVSFNLAVGVAVSQW